METMSRSLSKSSGEVLTSSSNHFSRRSGSIDDHDEETLTWAALEKLPTFTRLRTTIIQPHELVDVTKLGVGDRQKFIDSVFKVTDEDNEKFLKKFRSRIDRVGIKLPTVEVRFEKLTIEADCHIGKRALPTLPNVALNIAERGLRLFGLNFAKTTKLIILREASGIMKPSRMTLLLGPPSSGKTTLLLALAGKLDPSLKVTGRVTYNGYGLEEIVPQKTSAYISQNDVHIGVMTVQETLDFSARCQGIGTRYDLLSELVRREKDAGILPEPEVDLFMKSIAAGNVKSSLITDYTLKILGLDLCKDTMVGDEMTRGISGGQKKRVTTGEMIVGPTKTLFMDEISTGLDSSTTYQIVKCFQEVVRFTDATVLMSLLQPAPETFELFDDIILLSEGQIVYQGPRDHVLSFFEACGFKCPDRKGTADFLQEVTSRKDQEQYWADTTKPYIYIPVSEFSKQSKTFHVGANLENELSVPYDRFKSHPASLVFNKHSVPKSDLFKICWDRELLLIKRNAFFYVFKTVQIIIMALITSTVYLRTGMGTKDENDGAVYIGALIFSMIANMFNGFAELSLMIQRLPVFYKQRDLLFHPPWTFTLPAFLLSIPVTIFESVVWVSITYYLIGFAPEFIRYVKHLLVIFLTQQMAGSIFRFTAATCRSMILANTGGSLVILLLFLLGGFIIPRGEIPIWWKWAYWVSPMAYTYDALTVNEMLAPRWMNQHSSDNSTKLGLAVLEMFDAFTDPNWYWIGVGGILGFTILFNILVTLALAFLNPLEKPQAIVTKEKTEEIRAVSGSESEISYAKRGMVLPFTPYTMSFDNVNYYVDMPKEMKEEEGAKDKLQLLREVTGVFRPGVLTALMGVSGAGKTTLMDVLAGRKTGGYIEGDIRISGFPKRQETFARISGYCEQNDIHSPQVTVRESLIYSAFLRLPKEITKDEKMRFVDQVMELVELKSLKDAIVGLPGITGLSTEQRKRLTIAVELVANPSIIFMDEPTSGLDARAAAIVMRTVRNTVDTGGQVIYAGPLGQNSHNIIEYFQAIHGVQKIKEKYNPATWMLEVSSMAAEAKLEIDFAEHYKTSLLYEQNKKLVKELSTPPQGEKDLYFSTQFSQSLLGQFKSCLWKQWITYWRTPDYNLARFFFALVAALMVGSIFWKVGTKRDNANDLTKVIGAMYAAVLFVGVNNSTSVQPLVAVERTVFYRERAAKMYSVLPYALAQVVCEVPYVLFQTTYYTLIVYTMLCFEWTMVKFFWFFFVSFVSFLYFTYYGMMAVAITPNQQVAAVFAGAFYGLFNLFSGFLIPRPRIPKWWVWYYWICPVAWTVYGLIVSQYGDVEDTIKVPGMMNDPTIKWYIKNHYGYDPNFMSSIAAVLVGFTVFFAFMFAFGIKMLNFQQR
ncbi:BnaA01g28090D [Brassica napus]|uniref:BnaA01g28090D protein n=1 Tax=Brassica napus TaxID=3708 RepID=A0A078G6C9_BRANA|nr:BnaA01g28090D [Brassica napus]